MSAHGTTRTRYENNERSKLQHHFYSSLALYRYELAFQFSWRDGWSKNVYNSRFKELCRVRCCETASVAAFSELKIAPDLFASEFGTSSGVNQHHIISLAAQCNQLSYIIIRSQFTHYSASN